jgi:hypothetical protein
MNANTRKLYKQDVYSSRSFGITVIMSCSFRWNKHAQIGKHETQNFGGKLDL